MKKRQVTAVVAGLFLLLVPLLVGAQHLPPVACPDFPQREPATSKVTVTIAEALKPSGVVCVHVANAGKRAIQLGPGGARLQMREKTGKKPRFRDYETVVKEHRALTSGETGGIEREGTFAVGQGVEIEAHGTLALILPTNELPVGSGLYRVCLGYTLLGEKKVAQRCSPVVPVSSSLPNCPPLPVQPPARRVSLHVAKAIDRPGVVCVRALNGLAAPVTYDGLSFWLQRWDKDHWVQRDYGAESVLTLPSGETIPVMFASPAYGLPEGESIDRYLPGSGKPAPPGKYRACFTISSPNKKGQEHICGQAFFLP